MTEREILGAIFGNRKFKRVLSKRLKPRKRKSRTGKLGIVRLDAAGMKDLREERYAIDEGKCVDCGKVLPLEGSIFERAHLAHIVSRGAGGGDTIENTRIKCYHDHIEVEHCGGKVVPKKG